MSGAGRTVGPAEMLVVREAQTDTLLARGVLGRDVVKYHGALYFRPEAVVASDRLRVSERTATSPTLGVSRWIDLAASAEPDAPVIARSVAWIYPEPPPGHELLRDRYGFHPGSRGMTRQTAQPATEPL